MVELKFEDIKKCSTERIIVLKNLPKGGDLHNHSLGGGYSEFIYEKAIERNSFYDLDTHFFLTDDEYNKSNKNSSIIPIDKFKQSYTFDFFDNYSIRGLKHLSDGRNHFFKTFPMTISSKVTENELILEIAKRNKLENISYVEIISDCIPLSISSLYKSLFSLNDFSFDKLDEYISILEKENTNLNYLEVKKFLNEREEFIKEHNGDQVTIKYFPYLRRSSSTLMEFFIEGYYSILYSILDKRIAGVNIVEVEDDINSRLNYDSHLHILKYLFYYFKNKYSVSPNYSLHAGELTLNIAPLEDMIDRIKSSVFLSKECSKNSEPLTKRIGHGVSVKWENPSTIQALKLHKIPIEICLTSNEIILGIKNEDHPFNFYKNHNIPMVICTDDEGVSRSNIILEYFKAVTRYNLSYFDLKQLIRNSLEFSFLEGEGLFSTPSHMSKDFYSNIRDEFSDISSLEQWETEEEKYHLLIEKNEKLKLQIKLEKDFLKFEKNFYL